MDGRLDTCSITEYTIYNNNTIYDSKIWSVDLKPNVLVKGLSITNNKFVELNQHFKVVLEGTCSIPDSIGDSDASAASSGGKWELTKWT